MNSRLLPVALGAATLGAAAIAWMLRVAPPVVALAPALAQGTTVAAAPLASLANDGETNVLTRDPSTIIERGGTYWVYGTGQGMQQFSSRDRVHWTKHQPVLKTAPAWVAKTSPKNTDNTVWAPDVHRIGDAYYLYFSYSEFGTNHSGIGVATSQTLAPDSWQDRGLVISSGAQTNFNTIDPAAFDDADGQPWLVFGSYFSGIKLAALDARTGKLKTPVKLYDVATRPQTGGNPIEAPYIYYHDGYYYLWVNWDSCCAGAKSQYNVRVGRSRHVTGPYVDQDGVDLRQGGGSLFLNATFDDGSGRPVGDEVGPGHVGVLREGNKFWVSTHYEWARDRQGATTMNVRALSWDGDGWPRAVVPPGPYKIVSALPSQSLLTVNDAATPAQSAVEIMFDRGSKAQRWTLNYLGDGFYNVRNAASGRALSVRGDAATAGAKIELAPFANRSGQAWQLRANADGTSTLLSRASDQKVALDVNGCQPSDGTPVQTWTSNGLPCQKWSFRVR